MNTTRRGRPPKATWPPEPTPPSRVAPLPTCCFRIKDGVGLQQAWFHGDGTEWRTVPTVPEAAPDWEAR